MAYYDSYLPERGPSERPLLWLDETHLLTVEEGGLFLRADTFARLALFEEEDTAIRLLPKCKAGGAIWFETRRVRTNGDSLVGYRSMVIERSASDEFEVIESSSFEYPDINIFDICETFFRPLGFDDIDAPIPSASPMEIRPWFLCFSCGCGCYASETVILGGEDVYLRVAGYPVYPARRGLYRLAQAEEGPAWEKVLNGRLYSLAISPGGQRIAFQRLRPDGFDFQIQDL